MSSEESKLIILTLDAGGTNFVFSAIKNGKKIGNSIHLPALTDDEDSCTQTIIKGYELLKQHIQINISAISFAFPGPADYPNGIIGDLPNFSGINGNYPLKNILENHFKLPVFINNDGNLFAYGEALSGVLPEMNSKLQQAENPKEFKNLIGITLGTGIGCGIVLNKHLLNGDNSNGAEIHNLPNPFNPNWNIEESVSTRAIQRVYAEKSGIKKDISLMPEAIYKIAKGIKEGNQEAAKYTFKTYGKALGNAISTVLTLIDGLVVIGGGITAAWELFAPDLFKSMHSKYQNVNGLLSFRTTMKIYNLENAVEFKNFLNNRMPKTGVILSKNNANDSTALGAYYFAVSELNKR